jgi:hypothetical protein
MTNAFTQKPDLTEFTKSLRKSKNSAKSGRKVSANPTGAQRSLLFGVVSADSKRTKVRSS